MNNEKIRIWSMLLSSSTLGVEGHAGAPGWDWEE